MSQEVEATSPKENTRGRGGRGGRGRGGKGGEGPQGAPRPRRPEELEYDKQAEEITKQIDALMASQKALDEKIKGRNVGKDEYQTKRDEMKAKIDEYQSAIDRLEGTKKKIQDAINNKQDEAKRVKMEAQEARKKLGFTSEAEIEAKIEEIEYQIHTGTMSLKEEKKLVQQLTELKKQKPLIGKVNAKVSASENFDDKALGPLKEELTRVKDELNEAWKCKKLQNEQLRVLLDERKNATSDMKELFDEKDKIKADIMTLKQKRTTLKEEMEEKRKKRIAEENERRALRQEKYKIEKKRREDERVKRDLERELESIENNQEPKGSDMHKVEQTIVYLTTLVKADETKENTETAKHDLDKLEASKPKEAKGQILVPKNQRIEEVYFAPTGGKKKKGEKKENKEEEKGDKKIKHNITTYTTFKELNLEVPLTVQDCPDLITALQERLKTLKAENEELKKDSVNRKKEIEEKLAEHIAKMNESEVALKNADKRAKELGKEEAAPAPVTAEA